jgi:hypothetical protein
VVFLCGWWLLCQREGKGWRGGSTQEARKRPELALPVAWRFDVSQSFPSLTPCLTFWNSHCAYHLGPAISSLSHTFLMLIPEYVEITCEELLETHQTISLSGLKGHGNIIAMWGHSGRPIQLVTHTTKVPMLQVFIMVILAILVTAIIVAPPEGLKFVKSIQNTKALKTSTPQGSALARSCLYLSFALCALSRKST